MTIACAGPDSQLGVAIRFSTYLDCQARALGENGYQAIAGGPVAAGLLSGLITIFVALIGYRLILGRTPDLRDGVGWAARLGIVLTLATSWPAFQTLIYRVAVDAPEELAALLLPASGLPAEGLETRVQQAYDTMRLGSVAAQAQTEDQAATAGAQSSESQPSPQQRQGLPSSTGQGPLPQTASIFVVATLGVVAAFRVAIGFLLAIGPLAVLGLLFDATFGVFSGWVRAVAGAALALLGAVTVTAVNLIMIEGELGHLQVYARGMVSDVADAQALPTIVLLFALVMLVTVLLAVRVASAFRLQISVSTLTQANFGFTGPALMPQAAAPQPASGPNARSDGITGQTRTAAIVDALATTVRREQGQLMSDDGSTPPGAPSRMISGDQAGSRSAGDVASARLGVVGRRTIGRRTRSAVARDGIT